MMQIIPRSEGVVIGADFNEHVRAGNKGDEAGLVFRTYCRRTDGGRCNEDGNGSSEYFFPEEAGAKGDLKEQR